MNNFKNYLAIATLVLFILFGSCKKEEAQLDLTQDVVGTYQGKLTNSSTNLQSSSTSKVTRSNDYTVEIHCYGADFDTTFMLALYQDGNMMRVCTAGDDFYQEYGHQKSSNQNMMGDGRRMNWSDHMGADHQITDEHYGNFDTNNNVFDYTFNMESGTDKFTQHFIGNK